MKIYETVKKQIEETKAPVFLFTDITKSAGDCERLNKNLQPEVFSVEEKEEVLKLNKPTIRTIQGNSYFIEPFYPKERMIILGGGHVALPLVKFAQMTGFEVVLWDDRAEFSQTKRFPMASKVYGGELSQCLLKIKPMASDYIVMITRGHALDTCCLRELLKWEEPVYLGLIGSKRRTTAVFKQLEKEHFPSTRIAKIKTPIGLPIGAQTTEEIGISIMAEVIQRKRLESTYHPLVNHSDLDVDGLNLLIGQQTPFALATIMEASGSVPRKEGAKMLIFENGNILGTIGGGGVENTIIQEGKKILHTNTYHVYNISLDGKDIMAKEMVCGGFLKILLEDLSNY